MFSESFWGPDGKRGAKVNLQRVDDAEAIPVVRGGF
jgi:hypothetical protein